MLGPPALAPPPEQREKTATLSLWQLRARFEVEEEKCQEHRDAASGAQRAEEVACAAWQDACGRRGGAETARAQLQREVAEARADVAVLARDLPLMLQGRCGELRGRLEEVRELTQRSCSNRTEQEELVAERGRLKGQADALWDQVEEWWEQTAPLVDHCRAWGAKGPALHRDHGHEETVAGKLDLHIRSEEHIERREAAAIEQITRSLGSLRVGFEASCERQEEAAAEARGRLESARLARLLEVEDLARSLQLRQQQLQAKTREEHFWKDRVSQLDRALEEAQARHGAAFGDLALAPPLADLALAAAQTAAGRNLQR